MACATPLVKGTDCGGPLSSVNATLPVGRRDPLGHGDRHGDDVIMVGVGWRLLR